MNAFIGIDVVRRFLVLVFVVQGLALASLLLRRAMQLEATSWELLTSLMAAQWPHVIFLSASLAVYWSWDRGIISGRLSLLMYSGIPMRRIVWAATKPMVVVTLLAMAFNITVFRAASYNISSLRALTELHSIESQLRRRHVFRLGPFQMVAQGATRKENNVALDHALLGVRDLVIVPTDARVSSNGISMANIQWAQLGAMHSGHLKQASLTFPPPAPLSFWWHLRNDPFGFVRGLVFGFDVLAFSLAAIACATWGGQRRRLAGFGMWLVFGVVGGLFTQAAVGSAFRGHTPWGPWMMLVPPTLILLASGILLHPNWTRRRGR